MHISDQSIKHSVSSLSSSCEVEEDVVKAIISFWMSKNIVREISNDMEVEGNATAASESYYEIIEQQTETE